MFRNCCIATRLRELTHRKHGGRLPDSFSTGENACVPHRSRPQPRRSQFLRHKRNRSLQVTRIVISLPRPSKSQSVYPQNHIDMKPSPRPIRLRLSLVLLMLFASFMAPSCSMYPLGDSHYPRYFGGHGSPVQPSGHVPSQIQRNNAFTFRS